MIFVLLACAVPMVLGTHDPATLLEGPASTDAGPSFEGREVVLVFEGDGSRVPIGALLDDHRPFITPVEQTYVLAQPGYVLFDSLARALEAGGARVWRSYGPLEGATTAPPSAAVVGFRLEDAEFHVWRTESESYHLVRARVAWRIGSAQGSDVVSVKAEPRRDALALAGVSLANALRARLP